ncbi:MAG: nucleotidyltransferase family protein [Thermoleophilia bacterium]
MSAADDLLLTAAVDRWIAAGADLDAVEEHRIGLLVAHRLRETGRPVPEELAIDERDAQVLAATAPRVLEDVRAAVEGPVILVKGLEAAAVYPVPATRAGFGDLDVIVADAPGAQRRLIAAGFEEVGDPADFVGLHHLRPLRRPGLPVLVEVHHRPKWVAWAPAPGIDELAEAALPGRSGVEGVLRPAPEHHALILAAHSWSNVPLRRLRDLIDVHRVAREADPALTAALARGHGLGGVWQTTRRAADWLIAPEGRAPLPLRTWARGLRGARDATVLENHLGRWTSPFWVRPPRAALADVGRVAAADLRPKAGEGWGAKARRTALVARNLGRAQPDHDDAAERLADPDRRV